MKHPPRTYFGPETSFVFCLESSTGEDVGKVKTATPNWREGDTFKLNDDYWRIVSIRIDDNQTIWTVEPVGPGHVQKSD
jgi:hypothetical protein